MGCHLLSTRLSYFLSPLIQTVYTRGEVAAVTKDISRKKKTVFKMACNCAFSWATWIQSCVIISLRFVTHFRKYFRFLTSPRIYFKFIIMWPVCMDIYLYLIGWRRQEEGGSRACSMYGVWGEVRDRGNLKDLSVDGRIILKWIFRKWSGGMGWIGS